MNFAEELDHNNRRDFTEDCVIALCEGKADASFLTLLAEDRGLTGVRVSFPDQGTGGGFGKDAFGKFLSAVVAKPGFGRHVKALAIFGDNDAANAFQQIADQIPTDVYVKPVTAGVIAEGAGRIPTAVFLYPDDEVGSLETLILRSSSWPAAKNHCVETYHACAVGENTWNRGHLDKFRLRCVLAATCDDPESSTTMLWKKKKHPFSIKHEAFSHVAEALNSTCARLSV